MVGHAQKPHTNINICWFYDKMLQSGLHSSKESPYLKQVNASTGSRYSKKINTNLCHKDAGCLYGGIKSRCFCVSLQPSAI